jgi:hypothetical protein
MRKGKRTFASRKRKIAGLCALVLAGVIGVGAYAFTAQNTVEDQHAGSGVGTVTGFVITHVDPTINAKGEVTKVTFKIAPEPTEASAYYSEATDLGQKPFEACTKAGVEEWNCKYATALTAKEFELMTEFYVTADVKA